MHDDKGDAAHMPRYARHRPWVRVALGGTAVLALTALTIWTLRQPIAENFIARELATRGVRADYDIVAIGLRTQRVENVVIGDPRNPDLTARWAEIDLSLTGLTPHVVAVRANGVRLRGQLRGGVLTLGALDRFRSADPATPLALPDLRLALTDARMRLESDFGAVGMSLDGAGNLRSGFRGQLAAVSPRLTLAGCALTDANAWLSLSTSNGRPRLAGPIRGAALGCRDQNVGVARPVVTLDARLSSGFDRWTGHADLSALAIKAAAATFVRPAGRIGFDGTAAGTRGTADLSAQAAGQGGLASGALELTGAYRFAPGRAGLDARIEGALSARDLHSTRSDPLASLRAATTGTPLAPLGLRLADAARAASRDNRTTLRFAADQSDMGRTLSLTNAQFSSRSGARIALAPDSRLSLDWPRASGRFAWALDGGVTMEGGGLPKAALRLTRNAAGGFGGQMFLDPYTAADARLAMDAVRFSAGSDGVTRFATSLRLDGPLQGGGIKGLVLPIDGTLSSGGALTINRNCTPLAFDAMRYGSLGLGTTRVRLCPDRGAPLLAYGPGGLSGGARVDALRLDGRLGESAMRLSAASGRLSLADRDFRLTDADLQLGDPAAPVRLSAASFAGRMDGGGLGGTMTGASGRIGTVPLLVGDAAGRWRYADSLLRVDGGLTLTDSATPHRFEALVSRDFTLALRDNRITAQGSLLEPRTGTLVARTDIVHDLASAKGHADLDVPGVTFTQALQPEMLTRLALGVVANARGTVAGKGQVRWTGSDVTSDGLFRTDAMDLAAAFGPVTGLSGELRFTDLVGLVSAPGQVARLASVNPGVEVTGGEVRYQLLPNQQVHIEGGEWPFAGGQLSLLPTTMDFSADKPRNLSFRVVGMDAGAFIQTLELDNVSATGTYDGLLPMIFDEHGGRIVGGVLVARQTGRAPLVLSDTANLRITCDPAQQGGTLAYVGPVSNEQLGVYGKMAFDALKHLQYKCLTIFMDGALDGELVTQVSFNGVNRGTPGERPKGIARNFIGLPLLFNIRIEAPFRGLLNTAQSFIDPSGLIRSNVGDQYAPVTQSPPVTSFGLAVQPAESDKGAQRDRK